MATVWGRLWAGYWLATAIVLSILVLVVHFLGAQAETPAVIRDTYGGGVGAFLALTVLALLFAAILTLGLVAIRVRRSSRTWT